MLQRLLAIIVATGISSAVLAEEATPVTPKGEVESLMNEGIRLAKEMLGKHGEFYPYGYVMRANGEVQSVAASDGTEHPTSHQLIDLLNTAFRKGADSGEYKATAVFIDVRVTPPGGTKTDAVRVGLEHRAGYCVDVYFPYSRSADGRVQFGELFASPREGVVFRTRTAPNQPPQPTRAAQPFEEPESERSGQRG